MIKIIPELMQTLQEQRHEQNQPYITTKGNIALHQNKNTHMGEQIDWTADYDGKEANIKLKITEIDNKSCETPAISIVINNAPAPTQAPTHTQSEQASASRSHSEHMHSHHPHSEHIHSEHTLPSAHTPSAQILTTPSINKSLSQRLEDDFLGEPRESQSFKIQTLSDEPGSMTKEEDENLLKILTALSTPNKSVQNRTPTPYPSSFEKQENPTYETPAPKTLHMHFETPTSSRGGSRRQKKRSVKTKSRRHKKTIKKDKIKNK
jgi:hypothetical protein